MIKVSYYTQHLLGSRQRSFKALSRDQMNTLHSKLSKLELQIIDEVSMVVAGMMKEVHILLFEECKAKVYVYLDKLQRWQSIKLYQLDKRSAMLL